MFICNALLLRQHIPSFCEYLFLPAIILLHLCVQLDPEELEDVRWFPRVEITQMLAGKHPDGIFLPPPTAIARQLVMSWVKRTANL
jgi:hypothetical protein